MLSYLVTRKTERWRGDCIRKRGCLFLEVFVDTSKDEFEKRDTNELYKKAREGKEFTGIDQPYEAPDNPDVLVKTVEKSVPACGVDRAGDAVEGDRAQAAGEGEVFVAREMVEEARVEAKKMP